MKIKYLKLKNWLLVSFLSLLGFTACKSSKDAALTEQEAMDGKQLKPAEQDRRQAAVMYGVPTMEFRVRGKVVNSQGKPVKGIQVMLLNNSFDNTPDNVGDSNPYVEDYIRSYADTTAKDGSFDVRVTDRPVDYMRLYVRDVDGPSNGNYHNDVINVTFEPGDLKAKGEGWNQGTAQKDDFTVKIKEIR